MDRVVKLVLLLALAVGIPLGLYYAAPRSEQPDHLAAARSAIERRDFATARRELDEHLTHNPRDSAAELLAAQTARRADDGPAADEHLRRYLELGGDPEQAALEREMRRSQEGDVSSADSVLRFCDEHPDHPAVPFMLEALARGLMKAGRLGRATKCLDRWLALPLSPGDRAEGFFWRGQILESLNWSADAAEEYRRALAIDPAHAEARFRLAERLTEFDPREALAHYERLDRDTPGRPEVRLGLARCRRQLGDLDAAGQLLAPLLSERPNDPAVLTEAAVLALDRGRPADAEGLLRRAVALDPRHRDAHAQLARCYQELGREDEAREFREKSKRLEEDARRLRDAIAR
ncbi:MAG TPA: tetratricopeptide repeat protein [Gemmataceae bacterium]|nr:tetratricopeptide repeat protein [Gemmataceae bacterium]